MAVVALVIIGLVVVAFRLVSRRRSDEEPGPWPYIRGTDLYRRSLDAQRVAPFARQAQGLPIYHDESQWRDPPK